MKAWNQRPREVRNLFNPAFCGLILARGVEGFTETANRPMPFSLTLLPETCDSNYTGLNDLIEISPIPPAEPGASKLSLSPQTSESAPSDWERGILPPVKLHMPETVHSQIAKMEREHPGALALVLAYCTGETPDAFVRTRSNVVRRLRRAFSEGRLTLELIAGFEMQFGISDECPTVMGLIENADDWRMQLLEQIAEKNEKCFEIERSFSELPTPVKLTFETKDLWRLMHFDEAVRKTPVNSSEASLSDLSSLENREWISFLIRKFNFDASDLKRALFTKTYARFFCHKFGARVPDAKTALSMIPDAAKFKAIFGFDATLLHAILDQHRRNNLDQWRRIENQFGWVRKYADNHFKSENKFFSERQEAA